MEENEEQTEIIKVEINLQEICRICSSMNQYLIPIYDDEGINNLPEKFAYLPISISRNDVLPLQICVNCTNILLSFHNLYLSCLETDTKLRSYLTTDDCNTTIIDQEKLYDSENIEETHIPNDIVEIENIEYIDMNNIDSEVVEYLHEEDENNIDENNESNIEEYLSDNIEKSSELAENDEEQVSEENIENVETDATLGDDIELPSTDIGLTKSLLTRCSSNRKSNKIQEEIEICDLNAPVNEENNFAEEIEDDNMTLWLKVELNNEYEEDDVTDGIEPKVKKANLKKIYKRKGFFFCPDCSYKDNNCSSFEVHLVNKHNYDKTSIVARNTKLRTDKTALAKAKVLIDGKIQYRCNICNKHLMSSYTYMFHMKIHTGERLYKCELCEKSFRIHQGLNRHIKETHERIKEFPCDLCGKKFGNRRNVAEHRLIHTGERRHVCDICGKSFIQQASLFMHKRSHETVYPFRCRFCNIGFRSKAPMLLHMTMHTGEKPHECGICHRKFRIKHELSKHQAVHSDEKPFVCEDCGMSFKQKRYLLRHIKVTHSSEKSKTPELYTYMNYS